MRMHMPQAHAHAQATCTCTEHDTHMPHAHTHAFGSVAPIEMGELPGLSGEERERDRHIYTRELCCTCPMSAPKVDVQLQVEAPTLGGGIASCSVGVAVLWSCRNYLLRPTVACHERV